MKHHRFLALVTALLLMWLPCAHATVHIASYQATEDMTICNLSDAASLTAPEGLEELYSLVATGNPEATVHIFQMPAGMALVSISCLETKAEGSTESLYDQRDAIATGLQASLGDALPLTPAFRLEERYGQQALVTDLTLYLPDSQIQAEAKVAVFYRGVDLIEVWAIHPGLITYLFDNDATALLKSDLDAMNGLLESLDFTVPETDDEPTAAPATNVLEDLFHQDEPTDVPADDNGDSDDDADLPHMTITADDGTFRMDVPLDTVIIHAGSDQATVERGRSQFADVTGGETCFDLWYQDVVEQNCWLLISREYGVAAQVFVDEAGQMAGMSAQQLNQLEQPILEMMQGMYDSAEVMDEATTADVDGMEHAWLTYLLTEGDMNLLTYVLASADDTTLYELDLYIYTEEDTDADAVSQTVLMMLNSLDYLPDLDI